MNYRLYKNSGNGLEYIRTHYSLYELIKDLEHLIKPDVMMTIIVIEHNKKEDSDFPIFIYTGIYEKYEKFRSDVLTNLEIEKGMKL